MKTTEHLTCERIESFLLFQTSAAETAEAASVPHGVAVEAALFDRAPAAPVDERAGDAWTDFQLRAYER